MLIGHQVVKSYLRHTRKGYLSLLVGLCKLILWRKLIPYNSVDKGYALGEIN